MSIKKQSNGRYQVRKSARINGRLIPRKRSNILSLGEARNVERAFQEELKTLQAKARLGITTWKEALTEYETASVHKLAASTLYTQITTLKEYTRDWDQKELTSFTQEFIRTCIEGKMEKKSVSTKNNLAKFIRNVFEFQIGRGRLQSNPGKGVRFDDGGLKFKKLNAMSQSEIFRLFEEVKKIDERWYLVYKVVYELGLRSGEAFALKKRHFNLETNRVTIIESYCWKSKTNKVPKNREYRMVPLTEGLSDLLKPILEKIGDDDHVLPRIPSWRHGEAAKVLRSFQRQFGIKETNFHSIRASFITHLINASLPIPQIQMMVGHNDLKTTERYIRIDQKDLDGATDSLDSSKKKTTRIDQLIPQQSFLSIFDRLQTALQPPLQ
jgi:integrase